MNRFFGYGSLVNLATHDYTTPEKIHLKGWRRQWCFPRHRHAAFLSVTPCAHSTIAGLTAEVPGQDWSALDARERGYDRHDISALLSQPPGQTAIYQIPDNAKHQAHADHCILLSYLDVVIQGYFQQFGRNGVLDFIATTDCWDCPILDDRAQPIYPRAQILTRDEAALVDEVIADLPSPLQQPKPGQLTPKGIALIRGTA